MNKKSSTVSIPLLAILAFALSFAPQSAGAQARSISVKIQPAIFDEPVVPGQVLHRAVTATNVGSVAKAYYMTARNIKDISENGQPVFTDDKNDIYGLSDWISFDQKPFTLKPGETREMAFTVTVPNNVSPGGHFGGIFLASESDKQKETGAAIGLEVGSIISLRVAGDAVEEANIREFSTDKSVYADPNVRFSIVVENLGNVLVRPRGPIDIVNTFGKKVATLVVNDENAGVFPKGQRTFTSAWGSNELAFGRYQAIVSLLYGEGGRRTISSSVSFWVLPTRMILSVFAAFIALILAFYFGTRMYVRKKLAELQRGNAGVSRTAMPRQPSQLLFITLGFIFFSLILLAIIFILFS